MALAAMLFILPVSAYGEQGSRRTPEDVQASSPIARGEKAREVLNYLNTLKRRIDDSVLRGEIPENKGKLLKGLHRTAAREAAKAGGPRMSEQALGKVRAKAILISALMSKAFTTPTPITESELDSNLSLVSDGGTSDTGVDTSLQAENLTPQPSERPRVFRQPAAVTGTR